MKETLRIIAASAFITGFLIKAVPAFADPASARNISVVRTADLNLSSAVGQRELDRRLVLAAREVCGNASDLDLIGKNDVRECRNNVLAQARAKSGELVAGRTADRTIIIAAR